MYQPEYKKIRVDYFSTLYLKVVSKPRILKNTMQAKAISKRILRIQAMGKNFQLGRRGSSGVSLETTFEVDQKV